ncbi:NADPH:quinone reductase [Massilia sp. IC2-476]|uniref:NADPH:quinone reductase n=1 Tax=Massilia sp. IC2-476 TaxID=2887199 RepID=UPI001D0FBEDE|nr:NADPH:quinone reductase [Massilia sp. IC2-476]MCC2974541.1 NADPH:quinone reductase [Massilia sp. IC2-476]
MKAVVYRNMGEAQAVLELVELPTPAPGPGEVRVRVAYSGVNPSDTKARGGVSLAAMPYPYVVPHSDGSGVVDAIGPGADRSLRGRRVWFFNAQWLRQHGSAADYVCLPEQLVRPLPDHVGLLDAAGIGIPLLTAWHAVHAYTDVWNRTVLVTGGAGNVGLHAIQLARRAGARVLATASSAAKAGLARAAGAHDVFAYDDPAVLAARVKDASGGKGADLLVDVDAAFYAPLYPQLLAEGGSAVVYGSRAPDIRLDYRGMMRVAGSVSHFLVYKLGGVALAQALQGVDTLLDSGGHHFAPATVFAGSEAALAHVFVEQARPGKALLSFLPEG